jgi:hypothetical protein
LRHPALDWRNWISPTINFALLHVGWFACVLGAAHGQAAAGTLVAWIVVAIHVWRSQRPVQEIKLQAAAIALGLVVDSALLATGAIRYTSGYLPGPLGMHIAPPWIVACWMLLAATINVTLRGLHGRWGLSAVAGAALTPASYWAGVGLGAGTFVHAPLALGVIATGWALWMPVLVWLGMRFDGGGERWMA